MKIGLDLDEVCCDLVAHLCGHIGSTYDAYHDETVFGSYNFYENDYTGDTDINENVADNLVTTVNDTAFLGKSLPIKGAPEAVNALKSIGAEVHILTARAEGEEAHTIDWLRRHSFNFDSVTHVGYNSSKGIIGNAMALDIFVDDHTYNIDDMLKHSSAKVFIINKPWNIDYYDDRVTRIGHVSDLLSELNLTGEANG